MKTVQTSLLFILLLAVDSYSQGISATGIESTETRTETIKIEGLPTVAPNKEKVTTTPLELQNTVIALQLSIESNITINSPPSDDVQSTTAASTEPNKPSNSEGTTKDVDARVPIGVLDYSSTSKDIPADSKSNTCIPESISTSKSASDLPLPTTPSSLELVSTGTTTAVSESNTDIPESRSTSARASSSHKYIEPKNTTGSLQSSSTSESTVEPENTTRVRESNLTYESALPAGTSSSESIPTSSEIAQTISHSDYTSSVPPESSSASESASELPLPISPTSVESDASSIVETKSTTSVPKSKSTSETAPSSPELVSASTEIIQTTVEPKNTTGIRESSSTSENVSETSLPTGPSSSESTPESTAKTQAASDSENTTIQDPPDSSSTSVSDSPLVPTSFESVIPSIASAETNSTINVSESLSTTETAPSSPESIPALPETAQTTSGFENTQSIPPESSSAFASASESSILTVSGVPESIPSSTEAKIETTPPSEGWTVESTLCHSNCVISSVLAPAQSSITQQNDDKETENGSTSTNQTKTPIPSGLVGPGSSNSTEESVATEQNEVDSTVSASAIQSGTVSEADVEPTKTADSQNNEEPDGDLVPKLPAVPDSSLIYEMDYAAPKTETPDAAENPETSTGPAEISSSKTASALPLNPSEATETPNTPPESEAASTQSAADHEASSPIPCTEAGNFANTANCRTYTSCSGNVTDLLRQEIVCPERSAFSPVLQRCTRDISPCNDEPSCLYSGSIADPTNPSSYYWCVSSLLGGFHKYHIQCSTDEAFNALFGRCLLKTPTYGLIKPSSATPNDRDIAKAESKQMKKEIKAKAKEEKNRQKMAAKAKADAEKLALKQQKKQKDNIEDERDD